MKEQNENEDTRRYAEHVKKHSDLLADQDDCLIAISDGKSPSKRALYSLPPWRAVLIARVAVRAGVMTEEEVREMVEQARRVGGEGTLVLTENTTSKQKYVCPSCTSTRIIHASSLQNCPGLFESALPEKVVCGNRGCTDYAVKE